MSSLTLRLTVVGSGEEAAEASDEAAPPSTASTALVEPLPQTYGGGAAEGVAMDGGDADGAAAGGAADGGAADGGVAADFIDSSTTCEGADQLLQLYVAEGVARPIHVLCELLDPNAGDAVVASTEVALPLSSTGETKGTLETLPLHRSGAEEASMPYACLTIGYAARENYHELDEAALVAATTEADLAELLTEPIKAGALVPPVTATLCRAIEIAPPPADEAAAEPPAAATKGKGKEPEPEPEPSGPMIELYAVAAESGRAINVRLILPEEAIAARRAAHEQACADGQAAYEADLAAYEEAKAAAEAAAEADPEAAAAAAEEGGGLPQAPTPFARPAEPLSEWDLGTVLTKHGRLLVRGLTVPLDVPTGPATLMVAEATPPLALFDLPHVAPVSIPVTLLAEGDDAVPEPPPPTKGKK